MRIQNKIKRLRKQNKQSDEIQNISIFRGFVEGRILLSYSRGGGGGGDGGRGQRQRLGQRAEDRGRGRVAHFFSPPSHIIEKWVCGFLMGRSVKNMSPSKSPFVEAIEDKVRKKDKIAHNIR